MRSRAALIMVGIASLVAGCSTVPLWQAASLRGKPTGEVMAVSLPAAFHLDDSEHVFVKVSVNSHPSVWMLVDTGSTPSAINYEYAKSIGLRYDKDQQRGAGAGSGPINIRHTVVSSLQSGALIERQIPFVTVDYSRSGPDGRPVAGVLGYSFLRGHTILMDYRKGIVSISKRRLPRQSSVPFVLTNDIPTVQVSLNKRTINALLDTGGGYQLLLTPEAANRIGLQPSKSDTRQTSGVGYGGTQMLTVSAGPAFSVGDITKPKSDITYMPLPVKVDGALGTHLFKDYKVEFDYQSKLVRFSE